MLLGGLRPRRRAGRRASDLHRPVVDWHGPGLLGSAVLVLLLCALDAFLTLRLLAAGAYEANPFMALFVPDDVRAFAVVKMALTGGGIVALVAIARFRVFGAFRAASLVHVVLLGYAVLIGYEYRLLMKVAGLD